MPKPSSRPSSAPPAAFVFDAYGTLFDVDSLVADAEALVPGRGAELVRLWRAKQVEYTWLSSLMATDGRPRPDFDQVTALALDYAVAALVLPLAGGDLERLCGAWRTLAAFADARDVLAALAPRPRFILSNGTAAGLAALVRHNAMDALLDGVLSVDAVGVYKPAPPVYALAAQRLALPPERIGFVSANGWDAIGARTFGFTTYWINRSGLPVDRHGPWPDHVLGSLRELPAAVLAR